MSEKPVQKLILPKRHLDCEISVGEDKSNLSLEKQVERGVLAELSLSLDNSQFCIPAPAEAAFHNEEERLGAAPLDISSTHFERTRKQVRENLQAIVGAVFVAGGFSPSFGVDVGSGATGVMWAEFIPEDIRPRFIQIEVNKAAVERNRERNPNAQVFKGSYLNLLKIQGLTRKSVDMITGLSTLDATAYPERALEQMREVLKPGGHIFHFQDVRPGFGVIISELMIMEKERQISLENLKMLNGSEGAMQLQALEKAKEAGRISEDKYREAVGLLNQILALSFSKDPEILAFKTTKQTLSVLEIFRRRMERVINKTSGLEMRFNDWVISRRGLPAGSKVEKYYYANRLTTQVFEGDSPEKLHNEALGIVTVIQKL